MCNTEVYMVYNKKYDRWVSKDGLVYRYSKRQDKLILCKLGTDRGGYKRVYLKNGYIYAHRIVWETFNGEISNDLEVDHINSVRDDNRLTNLRIVTHKDNCNTKHFIKSNSESHRGLTWSNFGDKYKAKFNLSYSDNIKKYMKEYKFFRKHGYCSWEK